MKGRLGAQASMRGYVLPIRSGLRESLLKSAQGSAQGVAKTRGAKRKHHAIVLTDQQLMLVRKMKDWFGCSVSTICRLTGLEKRSVIHYVRFISRFDVDPGPRYPQSETFSECVEAIRLHFPDGRAP